MHYGHIMIPNGLGWGCGANVAWWDDPLSTGSYYPLVYLGISQCEELNLPRNAS